VGERVAQPDDAVHVIDKNLALLQPLGIDALGLREFPLPKAAADARNVARGLELLGLGAFAILNPGGGWANKQWPAAAFSALAKALRGNGLASLVTFGPGEEALAERVVAAADGAALRCFSTTLLEYVELCRRARLVVAADTGPLHLACAVGTPVVGLYGPTDPRRNGPFASADEVVRRVPSCAPCHKRQCATHARIMEQIAPAEVADAVARRLARAGARGSA
jgi:ADP-heptose:LPS heptosyltransferase